MLSTQTLWVPGPLPGLNEIIAAKRSRHKGHADGYSHMKKKWLQKVALAAHMAKLKPVEAARLFYEIREPNKRRDPSNFTSGAMKLIEDGLVAAGVLPGDGWRHVLAFEVQWSVSNNPGVMVRIEEAA